MHPVRRQISPHAARLRREQTDVEQRFWMAVRGRRLAGVKFRRQATVSRYVVDFLCVEKMLIVELDGGQHDAAVDADRTRFLEASGYRVLRFWNNEVLEDFEGVLQVVSHALEAVGEKGRRRTKRPSPNPLPQAGEG